MTERLSKAAADFAAANIAFRRSQLILERLREHIAKLEQRDTQLRGNLEQAKRELHGAALDGVMVIDSGGFHFHGKLDPNAFRRTPSVG
jgi:hypothetical protein